MRPTLFLLALIAGTAVQASWFGGDNHNNQPAEYTTWSAQELQNWLDAHNVPYPSNTPSQADLQAAVKAHWDSASQWTSEQYNKAQVAFANLKTDAFDTWDESRLREFLLEQGVVNPSGTREQLALLAKQKWRQYSSAASAYSKTASRTASSVASQASKSASALASSASAQASTAVYGDSLHQASKSASSIAALATDNAAIALEDTKDYVYSTWDDNRIRSYLQEHGIVEPPATPRNKLLAKMKETYAATVTPIYKAWSDSYIHNWLINHGIIKDSATKRREELLALMDRYYYDTKDYVWDSWSDSQMKAWLVDHGIIKSDAQLQREKMQKLVADNYAHAHDTAWAAWKDSDMHQWLINHGYLRSDAQKTRDDLVKLMNEKYTDVSARTAAYLTWPDARLRAYLREHGYSDEHLPTTRPGLLQEVRIHWVQTGNRASTLWRHIRDVFDSGVEVAEDKLGQILDILTGGAEGAKEGAKHGAREANEKHKAQKVEL
ncbi:hypothetical protein C8Q70DRAFT_1053922 [Cubamyces menziesii]|uniref:Meiotic sister chromatid recombination protein 1 n=1 Tax=Trametes cubensis TaxID=1111947 RepID=A0AAD7TGT9_9APHY|nr:hypothetical protein C8Q70DRAFT_1053922 [Cubamyces menziesii]KAJ8456866.1 hypothetical protein ONZ51_g11873 [Trametes cubensis]